MECRICFEEETSNNKLISPCSCSGTNQYVHTQCLLKWISIKKSKICPVCQKAYNFDIQSYLENNNNISNRINFLNTLSDFICSDSFTTSMTFLIYFVISYLFRKFKIKFSIFINLFYFLIFGLIYLQYFFQDDYIDFENFFVSIRENYDFIQNPHIFSIKVIFSVLWKCVENLKMILVMKILNVG